MTSPAHAYDASNAIYPLTLPSTQAGFSIRLITPSDNTVMARIIRTVMPEFGADGPGFAIHDAEVDAMYETYQSPGSIYYVIECEGRIIGGAGFSPLQGGDGDTCELKKMYFLKEARGHGLGAQIVPQLMEIARNAGYHTMYIETLSGMDAAIALYHKLGATPLSQPLGNTGHYSCDKFFTLKL